MRVCGIDIKANEIIVCILSLDRGLFEAPEIRQRRINVANADDPKQLRAFQQTVSKLMEDYKVDKIAIKARPQKGKFAGAASGFKLEAALQLLETHRANLISAAVIKETQKYEALPVDFRDTGLKAFQEQAFMAAYTQLVGPRYPAAKADKTDNDESQKTDSDSSEKPQFRRSERPSKEHQPASKPSSKSIADSAPSEKPPAKAAAKVSPWAQRAPKKAEQERAASKEQGDKSQAHENPWKKD